MIMRALFAVLLSAASLAGCSGVTTAPYEEPAESENTARVRVITNSSVYGDALATNCAPAKRHAMAIAGRYTRDGRPSINYPQYPLVSADLGMPKRIAPRLTQYVAAIRMAEGLYTEVVGEYRVRTDWPFQVSTAGAVIGSYGSTYTSCPAGARLVNFEAGKDYEVLAGVLVTPDADGQEAIRCAFAVFELVSIPGTKYVLPKRLALREPPTTQCKN